MGLTMNIVPIRRNVNSSIVFSKSFDVYEHAEIILLTVKNDVLKILDELRFIQFMNETSWIHNKKFMSTKKIMSNTLL